MKVKTRTIYMLIIILIVMVSAYLLDEWYRFERNSALLRMEHVSIVNKFFKSIGKRTTSVLKAESGLILRDKAAIEAYKSGDKQTLHALIKPYMQYMKAVFPGSKITLNFYKPDGTVYLMAQNPKKFGYNPVNYRPMLAYVIKNKKAATGFELCSSTLSQRYLAPIMDAGKFIGVIEVSTDISFISKRVSSISNITTAVLLNKSAIDALKCKSKLLFSVNYLNSSGIPFKMLDEKLRQSNSPYFTYNDSEYEIIKAFPLVTFNKSEVGKMYFITKTGGLESWFREHIARAVVICLIGVILLVYVARNGFIESIAELEKEHDDALADLKKVNLELEDRVRREVENCRKKDQIINQQQKVADMGMMLSALAHHWRQPINAVGLYVQDLSDAFRTGDLTKEYIDDFERNNMNLLIKLSDSIDKYRTFFEPSAEKSSFEITAILTEIAEILNATLSSAGVKMTISCKCGDGVECSFFDNVPECLFKKTEISGFLNEFKQTLLNIIYNSMDAIKQRYKIEKFANRDGLIKIEMIVNDDSISMLISDNGTGVPENIIDKIFNPFFTTKEEGMGTGIGLYMAKTVIEKYMCGTITAINNGKGVTMHITFQKNSTCL